MQSTKPTKPKENLSWPGMVNFVWFLLGDLRPRFAFLLISLLFLQIYELVPPIILGKVIDFFTNYQSGDSLTEVIKLAILLGSLHFGFSLLRVPARASLKNLVSELVYRVRVSGFEKLVDFSLTWHDEENSGNKVQRLQSGTFALEAIGKSIAAGGEGITVIIVRLIYSIGAFLFLSPVAAVFGLVYLLVAVLVHVGFTRRLKVLLDKRNRMLETASGAFFEGVNNVLTLKSLGVKENFKNKVGSSEKETKDFKIKLQNLRHIKVLFFHFEIGIASSLFVLILVWQFTANNISVGDILVFWTFFTQLRESTWGFTEVIDEFQEQKQGLARIVPIFLAEKEFADGDKKFPGDWKYITIKKGEFQYREAEEEFALENINLDVIRNEIVGIAGQSGSGKSSLVKLMLGLYRLQKGEYKIGDESFYDLDHEEVTKNITIVLQESELFNMTFLENITLLSPFDEEKFRKAIEVSQLQGVIDKLPQEVNTLIGEKGYRVSGGERQRLGIARAIYKGTDILILDEATSNLDAKTEAALQKSLQKELPNTTMLIIAHRLSTLEHADKIYVFDKGKIVESGEFNKLIHDKSSRFSELYQTQMKKD